MPGRAGFRMLLWISAAGLAGAGWFGWLVYRDYDWSGVRSPANSRSVPAPKAYSDSYQKDNQAVNTDETDLLGRTNTRWDGKHDFTNLYENSQYEADNQQDDNFHYGSESVNLPPTAKSANEDFVVVAPLQTIQEETLNLNLAPHNRTNEEFVVVQPGGSETGISPFLATTDEDFVVTADMGREDESEELPEVDLTDYVNNWTPIVPKIAALISHELWPQLRSFLESLPQFGDTNLERVVNAVAEDAGVDSANPSGVGEGQAEGFAFYASLFDEMAQESELVEA